jgi:RimJ/RimL family protein N-acetyltransferase
LKLRNVGWRASGNRPNANDVSVGVLDRYARVVREEARRPAVDALALEHLGHREPYVEQRRGASSVVRASHAANGAGRRRSTPFRIQCRANERAQGHGSDDAEVLATTEARISSLVDAVKNRPGNDTLRIAQMNVSLRPLEDRDLDTIYQHVTDPESVRMAAFTAEDQSDRRAFLNRMSRLRADTSVSYRVIDVDGAIAGTIGSFRIDNQPEVTYWVDRTQWGKGIASAALQILLAETAERPLCARAASDNVGSLRVLEKAGFRRVGVNRDFAPGRGEEIEETILRLD